MCGTTKYIEEPKHSWEKTKLEASCCLVSDYTRKAVVIKACGIGIKQEDQCNRIESLEINTGNHGQLILTQEPWINSGKRRVSSVYVGVGETGQLHAKEWN